MTLSKEMVMVELPISGESKAENGLAETEGSEGAGRSGRACVAVCITSLTFSANPIILPFSVFQEQMHFSEIAKITIKVAGPRGFQHKGLETGSVLNTRSLPSSQ